MISSVEKNGIDYNKKEEKTLKELRSETSFGQFQRSSQNKTGRKNSNPEKQRQKMKTNRKKKGNRKA